MDKTQEAKKLTHYDLLLFNRQGFLPLENESVESFLLRVANLQNSSDPHSCPKAKQAALQLCKQLFDVEPDWVSIIETQKELAFWQGAVMWVQTDHLGNDLPFIQISSRLNSALLRRWYSKEEVIAHELIHAIRLPLYSARFEEIIAYQTSHNPLRRFLGPLFRRPYEVYILLAALLGSWIGLFWDRFSFLQWLAWALCLFGILRLLHTQWVFKRCASKLSKLMKKANALELMVRLNDKEIALFSQSCLQEIHDYAQDKQKTQLRWQMLCAAYDLSLAKNG